MQFNQRVKFNWLPELEPYGFVITEEYKSDIILDNGLFRIYVSYDYRMSKDFNFLLCCRHGSILRYISEYDLYDLLDLPINPYEKLTEDELIEKFLCYFIPVFRKYGALIFNEEDFNNLWDASEMKLTLAM